MVTDWGFTEKKVYTKTLAGIEVEVEEVPVSTLYRKYILRVECDLNISYVAKHLAGACFDKMVDRELEATAIRLKRTANETV